MSIKTAEIVDRIKSLTMLEAAVLVKELEETFGVDASPRQQVFYPQPAAFQDSIPTPEPPAQTEFDVVLEFVPPDYGKIAVLKMVRQITGLSLKLSKELVDRIPSVIKSALPRSEAERIQQQLEAAGARVSLK